MGAWSPKHVEYRHIEVARNLYLYTNKPLCTLLEILIWYNNKMHGQNKIKKALYLYYMFLSIIWQQLNCGLRCLLRACKRVLIGLAFAGLSPRSSGFSLRWYNVECVAEWRDRFCTCACPRLCHSTCTQCSFIHHRRHVLLAAWLNYMPGNG